MTATSGSAPQDHDAAEWKQINTRNPPVSFKWISFFSNPDFFPTVKMPALVLCEYIGISLISIDLIEKIY
ncbi:MAG: hypothetical protein M0Q92_02265 [Methanoregula sp.]|jgi:hypothetical protein|nr:hypothetical protein [Methanoregula sp.]